MTNRYFFIAAYFKGVSLFLHLGGARLFSDILTHSMVRTCSVRVYPQAVIKAKYHTTRFLLVLIYEWPFQSTIIGIVKLNKIRDTPTTTILPGVLFDMERGVEIQNQRNQYYRYDCQKLLFHFRILCIQC